MAKIAILDDSPEIVALVAQALSPGDHELLKMVEGTRYMMDRLQAFAPAIIIIPIHRRHESMNRPLESYHDDILGTEVLERVCALPALNAVPIILFGFYTREHEMPADYRSSVRFDAFLEFPLGLQELNPLITGILHRQAGEK